MSYSHSVMKKKKRILKRLIGFQASKDTERLMRSLQHFFGFRARNRLIEYLMYSTAFSIANTPSPKNLTEKQEVAKKDLKRYVKQFREDADFRRLLLTDLKKKQR